jgi:hypothetical protein
MLIQQGESAKYVQDQVGHASITTTFNTYGHLMQQAKQETPAKLGKPSSAKKRRMRRKRLRTLHLSTEGGYVVRQNVDSRGLTDGESPAAEKGLLNFFRTLAGSSTI